MEKFINRTIISFIIVASLLSRTLSVITLENHLQEDENLMRQKRNHETKNCEFMKNNNIQNAIDSAYQTKADIENILKCVSTLESKENVAEILSHLYDKMKLKDDLNSHQIFVLAYKAKILMESDLLSQNHKDKLENLRINLPSPVRDIIWHGNDCTIRNSGYFEHVDFVMEQYDDQRRTVFSYSRILDADQLSKWAFEPLNEANHFKIKRWTSNEYLYGSDKDCYDVLSSRIKSNCVFTWIPGNSDKEEKAQWRLEPNRGGNTFKIYNLYLERYLQASPYKQDKNILDAYKKSAKQLFANTLDNEGYDFDWKIACQ